MGVVAQFRLLIWKSVKTAIRSPIWTLFEIVLPLAAFAMIIVTTRQYDYIDTSPRPKGDSYPRQLGLGAKGIKYPTAIDYMCPDNTSAAIQAKLKKVCGKYACTQTRYSEFNSNVDYYFDKLSDDEFTGTIYGYDVFYSTQYNIKASFDYAKSKSSVEFRMRRNQIYDLDKFASVFLTFAREMKNFTENIMYRDMGVPDIQPMNFSYTLFFEGLIVFLSIVPMFASVNVAREISLERETNMKEYLLVMGMSRKVYYAHHLIFGLAKALPATVAICVLIIIDQTTLGLHFLLAYVFFVCSMLSIATLIASIIKKANIATVVALALTPWTASLAYALPVRRTVIPLAVISCLNPGHAMSQIIDCLMEGAYRGNEITWFADLPYALPYGIVLIMLLFDILLYLSIAMIVDYMASSSENIFTRLMRTSKKANDEHEEVMNVNIHEIDEAISKAKVDIELDNVHKTWPSGERAVRGIDVKLYRGQVTVLLGHNGAGKSTTFAMIAGIVVPTSGTIKVGELGSTSVSDRQSIVGFCPQYNPIFPRLTVNEHLDFFARLKGVKEWREEGYRLLEALLLTDKANVMAKGLSGGMKRKLCVAMSLIGNSRVILLDEPTAGVDTGARRDIERLLMEQKKERTFLLTTHYTDEAEHLGDRVLIMAGGKIVCSGSPQFLNRKFGAGYILSCVSIDSKRMHDIAKETLSLVKNYVPSAYAERQHGQQFEIWLDKNECERFPDLFRHLESRRLEMGIESYGLSLNTLEQVFLRVGEMTGAKNRGDEVTDALNLLLKENVNRLCGFSRLFQCFQYLMYKRVLYEWINKKSLLLLMAITWVIIYTSSILNTMDFNGGGIQTHDITRFSKCSRIGIEKSSGINLNLLKSFINKDDCVVIEEMDLTWDYYEEMSMNRRPPVVAMMSRNSTTEDIVISMAPNGNLQLIPLLKVLIETIINSTLNVNIEYSEPPTSNYYSPPTMAMPFVTMIPFMIVQPMIIHRMVGFYVVERSVKFGHQQFLTGLSRPLYWFASIVADLINFLLCFVSMIVACFVFDVLLEQLTTLIPMLLLAFFVSVIKLYIIQRMFISKPKAEQFASIVLLVPYIALVVVYLINVMGKKEPSVFDLTTDYPMLLDPYVAILAYFVGGNNNLFSVYMFILGQFIVFYAIFLIMESKLMKIIERCYLSSNKITMSRSSPKLATAMPTDNLVLDVKELVKKYGKHIAVRGVTFGVQAHECFGLLGVNGAGKTSTFEVLTGNAIATAGTATVAGVDCATPARIGYCPQFDALMEEMSGRQNLLILAALHGYSNPSAVTDTVIECVGMTSHANKQSKSYSGGQRRKISVAGAMLAQNSLIILDEPTAGIDPVARRDIWSVICALRDSTKTAIVLTSHSMDEVEALCSRVAIMKTGEIAAHGTSQTLKSLYGNYFKLSIVVPIAASDSVLSTVQSAFPRARLLTGSSTSTYNLEIPKEPGQLWSTLFENAILVASKLNAIDYCLSQASLEDAFIAVASCSEPVNQ